MADSGLREPQEDSQKDLENDPSINSQVQETTIMASNAEEAQTLHSACVLSKDHQRVETVGPESADTGDKSESPDEANMGKHPKDKIEDENNQSFLDGEKGHHLPSENLGEEPLDPDPSHSPSDKVADANLGSSSVAPLMKQVTELEHLRNHLLQTPRRPRVLVIPLQGKRARIH